MYLFSSDLKLESLQIILLDCTLDPIILPPELLNQVILYPTPRGLDANS